MDGPMGWVLASLMVGAFAANLWAFERLIRCLYREHREAWEARGRPISLFFLPPEVWRGRRVAPSHACAAMWMALGWLVATPPWAEASRRQPELWAFRVASVVWLAGWATLASIR